MALRKNVTLTTTKLFSSWNFPLYLEKYHWLFIKQFPLIYKFLTIKTFLRQSKPQLNIFFHISDTHLIPSQEAVFSYHSFWIIFWWKGRCLHVSIS